MAVVIRLQGLPVVAGPPDIRRFFLGLNIPDGGVHIIGGEIGEAFIIFATDEDARRAMSCSGGFIKDARVELFLSSKAEMQSTIEMSRKRFDRGARESMSGSRRTGTNGSGTSSVGDIPHLVTTSPKGIRKPGYGPPNRLEAGFHTNGTRYGDGGVPKSNYQLRKDSHPFNPDDRYLFLRGIPYSATEVEVRAFLAGIRVDEVILIKHRNGLNNGDCLIKCATPGDALEGLKRHRQYMGQRFIEISPTTEERWIECGGRIDVPDEMDHFFCEDHSPMSSGYAHSRKHSRSRSPRRQRTHSRSSPGQEYYIHLRNLSFNVEKRDLRDFFPDLDIHSRQIKIVTDKHQKRTREAFVVFKSEREYQAALGCHRKVLLNRPVYIFPISRKSMLKIIDSCERKRSPDRDHLGQAISEKSYRDGHSSPKTCVYVRNFPFDVSKMEVQKFFARFDIDKDDIYLLYDEKGVGLGEALVKFKSEEQALKAENLNRQTFLGTEVLIRLISQDQMQKFGVAAPLSAPNEMHGHSHPYDRADLPRPVGSPPSGPPQGPLMHSYGPPGNFRHHSDFRHPPEDFMCPPKDFRGPPPLMDFGGNSEPFGRMEFGNNKMGNFSEGRFMADPNFSGGSERVVPILLKNLPFKATPNEILDFFYGYRVIPESVSVQYNEQGLPSGDAIVAMTNYEEAMAAINELNDRPIGPRKVKLSLL